MSPVDVTQTGHPGPDKRWMFLGMIYIPLCNNKENARNAKNAGHAKNSGNDHRGTTAPGQQVTTLQASDFGFQTSDFRLQTPDFRLQKSV